MIAITPHGVRHPVAEGIIALMFALSKHVIARDKAVRAGEWRNTIQMGVELGGRTLGSIGIGNIAGELFRLLHRSTCVSWHTIPTPQSISPNP